MRKFYIIGTGTVVVLLGVMAVMLYLQPKEQVAKPLVIQKTEKISDKASTGEITIRQETKSEIEKSQSIEETKPLASTQKLTHNGPRINLQKILDTFTKDPYNYTFEEKINRVTNKKTTIAVADGLTIGTVGDIDDNLESAWISVLLKKDRSNKKIAIKNVGNFAETIN